MKLYLKLTFILFAFFAVCVSARADSSLDLIIAAGHGETNTVRQLLDQGADANAADSYGITALMYAAHSGSTSTVKLLLEKRANANAKAAMLGLTALMNAAGFGDTEMVEALLNKGAKVNEKNNDGATALTIAQEAGKTANVKLLRQHGAN
jgi:uncharacterized protein